MLETLLQKDTELLLLLNSLGSKQWDAMWLAITNQLHWTPLFVFILYLIFRNFGAKKGAFIFLFIVLLIAFSDQFTNFVKNFTERVRPCNVADLQQDLRQFTYKPRGFSFWSGHASLSLAFTTFVILLLRSKFKFVYAFLIFPILFGYSRIYLGVHYPLDVTSGYIMGIVIGVTAYKILQFLFQKTFKEALV